MRRTYKSRDALSRGMAVIGALGTILQPASCIELSYPEHATRARSRNCRWSIQPSGLRVDGEPQSICTE